MKVSHRIRCHLIVLLVMVHFSTAAKPPKPDFTKCGEDKKIRCYVHEKSCVDDDGANEYVTARVKKIKSSCGRFFIIEAKSLMEVAVEFRDDTVPKNTGVAFFSGDKKKNFECKDNNAASSLTTSPKVTFSTTDYGKYDTLICEFSISVNNNNNEDKTIADYLKDYKPVKVGASKSSAVSLGFSVDHLDYPCEWNGNMFKNAENAVSDEIEEYHPLETSADGKICPPEYFNWYMKYSRGPREKWVKINNFTCYEGKISTTKNKDDGKDIELDFKNDLTKCTRLRCAACTCPFCNATDSTTPHFIPSDGEKCNVIKCNNTAAKMLVSTPLGKVVRLSDSITCTVKKAGEDYKTTWGDFDKIEGVKCISEVRCTEIDPIESVCKDAEVPPDYECVNTTLKDDGADVCDTDQPKIFYSPKGTDGRILAANFKCNVTTGHWDWGSKEQIAPGSNVVCLRPKTEPAQPVAQSSAFGAGKIIGIILGVACLVIIIIVVVIYCLRRHSKKGKQEGVKSVSVTGKNDKKSKKNKDKKGKSSSSATSEVSAPAPPPCPDTLVFQVEPDPPVPKVGAPPSSGGNSLVGPDTGKPDKPAELIDIKLESEAKKSEEKSKAGDVTVANTVTGTSFDKSNVGTVSKKEESKTDVTDTKKTEKNGESARSDTGKTNDGTKKRRKYKDKNGKVQLDKNGKGLTDDDDIDEGAKPVSHVDKNKKPYVPAIDPRKKFINVTETEDEDGRIKPKKRPIF